VNRRRQNPYARADARTRAAKAQGYLARSVFKLQEIDRRLKILRRGQRVLDLGASPGSWTQYAAERIGPEGYVMAIDVKPLREAAGKTIHFVQGDVTLPNPDVAQHAPYDVVLSDMAPNTSGSKVRDQALSFELFKRALELAVALGRPGSSFVGKIFMSEDFAKARSATAAAYSRVQVIRPEATRRQSSELFIVGLELRPGSDG
jgi:23S rRNA (uridine2552-2'-O)-methyltransferase